MIKVIKENDSYKAIAFNWHAKIYWAANIITNTNLGLKYKYWFTYANFHNFKYSRKALRFTINAHLKATNNYYD